MAASKRKRTSKASKSRGATMLTNSAKRKANAHKAGKCQICNEKGTGYSVILNRDTDKFSIVRAKDGHARYCKKHAETKKARREHKLEQRRENGVSGSSGKAKKGTSRKAKASSKAKATAKKRTTKRTTKRGSGTSKRSRSSAKEPF